MNIIQVIEDLIKSLSGIDLSADLATVEKIALQILSALGDKNAERDIQSQDAYNAALLGSVAAAQYLYHNSQPDSGMPHEDIVDGQFYWGKLQVVGWTANNGTVVPPAPKTPPVQ